MLTEKCLYVKGVKKKTDQTVLVHSRAINTKGGQSDHKRTNLHESEDVLAAKELVSLPHIRQPEGLVRDLFVGGESWRNSRQK